MADRIEYLYPDYLELDYPTIKQTFRELLQESETFEDVNYEGSNISVLMELQSYIAELNTYYLNKLAKNVYPDTVDVYENASRLSGWLGYSPKGTISATGNMKVTLKQYTPDKDIKISPWHRIISSAETEDGDKIFYAVTNGHRIRVEDWGDEDRIDDPYSRKIDSENGTFTFYIPIIQGTILEFLESEGNEYRGRDLIDGKLFLPNYTFAHNTSENTSLNPIEVMVNGETWTRVEDFFEDITSLNTNEKVYKFNYDKYGRYVIEFSNLRQVPSKNDIISVRILISNGEDGNIGANSLEEPDPNFIINLFDSDLHGQTTQISYISNDHIKITNETATIGGVPPENINTLMRNAKNTIYEQYRCVTTEDYESFLAKRSDIAAVGAYGENEIAPTGHMLEFNKVHLNILPPGNPNEWTDSEAYKEVDSSFSWKITDEEDIVYSGTSPSASGNLVKEDPLYLPKKYSNEYTEDILKYLNERKSFCSYEVFTNPSLCYFFFRIGVKPKRLFDIVTIREDLEAKLQYYFSYEFRRFGEIIDFSDIEDFLMDTTITSDDNNFSNINGIQNMIFRDILVSTIWSEYDYNEEKHITYATTKIREEDEKEEDITVDFPPSGKPQYTKERTSHYDNRLRPIELAYNQFPIYFGFELID